MTNEVNERPRTQDSRMSSQSHGVEDLGWYLYGITQASDCQLAGAGADSVSETVSTSATGSGGPVRSIICGDLAAVARQVPLSDFSQESLAARIRDLDTLEELANHHNAVIASIYQRQAILPAKFGHVYPNEDALRDALLGIHEALLSQLERLKDCDEWAVHVYIEPDAIERGLLDKQQATLSSRQEPGRTQPGRAYLLKRKLAVELAALTEQTIWDLTREILDRLEGLSLASELTPIEGSSGNSTTPREVLRAAFLVSRTNLGAFLDAVDAAERDYEGVRCTSSGPWPPYSFAELSAEDS